MKNMDCSKYIKPIIPSALLAAVLAVNAEVDEPPVKIAIAEVEILDLGRDRIRFGVTLVVDAAQALRVRGIVFEGFRMQNVPMYLPPLLREVELEPHKPFRHERVPVTVYFRDLESLQPIETMLRDGQVPISGRITADLRLGLLTKITLWTRQAKATLRVNKTMPLDIPGGAAGRLGALAIVRLSDAALKVLRSVRDNFHPNTFRGDLKNEFLPYFLRLQTHFQVEDRKGETLSYSVDASGYQLDSSHFVTTREAVEPWEWDPDLQAAIKSKEISLVTSSVDLLAWSPVSPNRVFRLQKKDFRLVRHAPEGGFTTILTKGPSGVKKLQLPVRASLANLSLLEFRDGAGAAC